MKRKLFFIAAIFATLVFSKCTSTATVEGESAEAEASAESFNFVEDHGPVWDEAIAQVMELAESMPEDQYSFTPHDTVRTFAGQLMHIGDASLVMAKMFLQDIQPEGPPADVDVNEMSKEEIIAAVKKNLEEVGEIMKTMSDQKLDEDIKSFSGNTMSRREGLLLIHDHLTNHKAKANLYVRISGNQPPAYRYY